VSAEFTRHVQVAGREGVAFPRSWNAPRWLEFAPQPMLQRGTRRTYRAKHLRTKQ
jgi:hypothetical protein